MKMTKQEKNTECVNLRLTPQTKELLDNSAKKRGKSRSNYLRYLIKQDAEAIRNNQIAGPDTQQGISHGQMVINSLSENHFINTLLTNKEFSNKSKAIIGREMRKYVKH